MSEPVLNAELRQITGKAESRRIRTTGRVPCILYGVEKDSVSLTVNRKEFEKLMSETRSVFVVDFKEKQQRSVVKEIQYHPVRGEIIHVDLLRVKAGQEINVSVPLKFSGESPGVKVGGVFQELKTDLDITCLPKYMPNDIEIDISELNIGDSIHVSDLQLDNITVKNDPSTSLCPVVPPRKIEEVEPETDEELEEEEEETAEPEVITAKKDAEDESEEKGSE